MRVGIGILGGGTVGGTLARKLVEDTAVIAAKSGLVLVTGWAHEAAGLLMFVVSMGLLLAWRKLLRWVESSLRAPSPAS